MSPPQGIGSPMKTWRKAWSDWARRAGLDVAWANQRENPAERRKPFVRLQVIALAPVGRDEQLAVFDETSQERHGVLQGMRQVTLNVQVVSNPEPELEASAWAWADELLGTLETDEVAELFRQAGLSVSGVGQILDLGGIEQSQLVSRATFEIVFLAAYYRVNPAAGDWIDRVIGEGDLEGNSAPEISFDVEGP